MYSCVCRRVAPYLFGELACGHTCLGLPATCRYWKFTINRRWETQQHKEGKSSAAPKPMPQTREQVSHLLLPQLFSLLQASDASISSGSVYSSPRLALHLHLSTRFWCAQLGPLLILFGRLQVLSQLAGLKRRAAERAHAQPRQPAASTETHQYYQPSSAPHSQDSEAAPAGFAAQEQPSVGGASTLQHAAAVSASEEPSEAAAAAEAPNSVADAGDSGAAAFGAASDAAEGLRTVPSAASLSSMPDAGFEGGVTIGHIRREYHSSRALISKRSSGRGGGGAMYAAGQYRSSTSVRIRVCNALRHARHEVVHAAQALRLPQLWEHTEFAHPTDYLSEYFQHLHASEAGHQHATVGGGDWAVHSPHAQQSSRFAEVHAGVGDGHVGSVTGGERSSGLAPAALQRLDGRHSKGDDASGSGAAQGGLDANEHSQVVSQLAGLKRKAALKRRA